MTTIIVNGQKFSGEHVAIRNGVVMTDANCQERRDEPITEVIVIGGEIKQLEVGETS